MHPAALSHMGANKPEEMCILRSHHDDHDDYDEYDDTDYTDDDYDAHYDDHDDNGHDKNDDEDKAYKRMMMIMPTIIIIINCFQKANLQQHRDPSSPLHRDLSSPATCRRSLQCQRGAGDGDG